MDLNAWAIERRISRGAMATWIGDGLYQPPVVFSGCTYRTCDIGMLFRCTASAARCFWSMPICIAPGCCFQKARTGF